MEGVKIMSRKLGRHEMEFIIARVVKNANDSVIEEKEEPCEFNKGRRQAYYEVLDTIKNELLFREQNLKDYGYDEDWERRLMFG